MVVPGHVKWQVFFYVMKNFIKKVKLTKYNFLIGKGMRRGIDVRE